MDIKFKKLFFVYLKENIKDLNDKNWLELYKLGLNYENIFSINIIYDILKKFFEKIYLDDYKSINTILDKKIKEFENQLNNNSIKDKVHAYLNKYSSINWDIIFYKEKDYPLSFLEIKKPPIYFFVAGPLRNYLNHPLNIAIVGSRKCTHYGLSITRDVIESIATYKLPLVSGLALGIDIFATETSLKFKLPSMVFMPCGLFTCYPYQNRRVYDQLLNEGLIITEYSFDVKPQAYFFCNRNRLISGIASSVIIPEAEAKSGSVMTGHIALEQGKLVYTFPGNVYNPNSQGCHDLILDNAQLCSTPSDIITRIFEDLPSYLKERFISWQKENIKKEDIHNKLVQEKVPISLNEIEKKILNALKIKNYTFNELIEDLHLDLTHLMINLSALEIKGLIITQFNRYYLTKQ